MTVVLSLARLLVVVAGIADGQARETAEEGHKADQPERETNPARPGRYQPARGASYADGPGSTMTAVP